MAARYLNQYTVNYGAGKPDNADTKLFHDLARASDKFHKNAKMSCPDSRGVYECYFLKDGILYSGTTNIPPTHDSMSCVQALKVHRSIQGPVRTWIHSTSENVLWNIRRRQ